MIDDVGHTALCPYCGVDAVIGESLDCDLSPELLVRMKGAWF